MPKKQPVRKPMVSINTGEVSRKSNRSDLLSQAENGPNKLTAHQYAHAMIKYRRKSLSQIDLKQARRSKAADKTNVPLRETQMAGMRVYEAILLNAYRKRRNEAEELKKNYIKMKNQLHVFNALFDSEKERNEELSEKLKNLTETNATLKDSEMNLQNRLIDCKLEISNLSEQLEKVTNNHSGLEEIYKQTESELQKMMIYFEETQADLNVKDDKIEKLEKERDQLLENVTLITQQIENEKNQLVESLIEKDTKLELTRNELKCLEFKYLNTKEVFKGHVNDAMAKENKLCMDMEVLESEVKLLRSCLAATLGQRLKNCLDKSILIQRASCQFVHKITADLLPGIPQPKVIPTFPFRFNFEKLLNVIKD